ncbi:putative iron-regulated membrane protein [Catalinimonas alkaloidigena]|uniref:PepSY-associated TM helix domain-containing protein n=1 Tax=Catalinimonas alkaloidigena TaxID=1075417 RepID=UPI002404A84E|nr:PepSY-associated TM helix domain-containing protein [Catalinimonas alkaloidigena]MDF9795456.1 putative iron-regulated membrane protein [Catalinimonas alkaloidigena]
MFRLHRWLMLDTEIGRPIVRWSTVIFALLIMCGLVIWFPQKAKSWKQGLKLKWYEKRKRFNHNLHNALGFYTAIFLLIMALTDLQGSFDGYRTALRSVLGVSEPERKRKRWFRKELMVFLFAKRVIFHAQ